LENFFNQTIDFDSNDLGCSPFDRTFESGIQEINDWINMNPNEVIFVLINDEGHSADWGHQDLIQKLIHNVFGPILFTPVDKNKHYPNTWPSVNQLNELGKKVIVYGSNLLINDEIFGEFTIPHWDQNTMKYFSKRPYPECDGFNPGQWTTFGGESQIVGPIYNGPGEEGLLIKENLNALLDCSITLPSFDLLNGPLLNQGVWTLSSIPNISNGCMAMIGNEDNPNFGKWITLDCSLKFHYACLVEKNNFWDISQSVGPWSQNNCVTGNFSLPRIPHLNRKLKDTLIGRKLNYVWINYKY